MNAFMHLTFHRRSQVKITQDESTGTIKIEVCDRVTLERIIIECPKVAGVEIFLQDPPVRTPDPSHQESNAPVQPRTWRRLPDGTPNRQVQGHD